MTEADDYDDSMLFPQKLMEILADPENHESIAWLPSGRAFFIRNRTLFAETVMPRYFSRKAKYSSFARKLNRWNFLRLSSGAEIGAYHHKFFLRDQPHLAAQMFCKNARTMLAMQASASNQTQDAVVVAEKPPSPTTVLDSSNLPPQLRQTPQCVVSPNVQPDEELQKSGLTSAATAFAASFGSSSCLQLLDRQLMFLQQQKEQANRLLIERAMLFQQHPASFQQEQERLLQIREIMQTGMQQQQRTRQPSNNRASAA